MKSSAVRHSRASRGLPSLCAGGKGMLPVALLLLGFSLPCAHGDPPPKAKANAGSTGEKRSDSDSEILKLMMTNLEKSSGPTSKQKSKSLSNLNLLGSDSKAALDRRQNKGTLDYLAGSQGSLSGLYQPTANTKPAPPTPPPTRREARVIDVEAENQAFEHAQLASLQAPIPQPEGPKPILAIEQVEVAQEHRAAVTKVVGSSMDKLRRCYEEALRRKSDLSGTVE